MGRMRNVSWPIPHLLKVVFSDSTLHLTAHLRAASWKFTIWLLINAKILNSTPGPDDIWPIDGPSQTKAKTFTQLENNPGCLPINQHFFSCFTYKRVSPRQTLRPCTNIYSLLTINILKTSSFKFSWLIFDSKKGRGLTYLN